jgi:hypothetical protein
VQCGGSTEHAGGQKASYWSARRSESLTANIGKFGSIVTVMFTFFFECRMFSRCIISNITPARGTLHCRKTRIPCGNQLVICGLKSRRRPTFHRCILPPSSDDDNDEVSTSEPSRYLNDTTRHHISEGCYIRCAFCCSQYLRHVLFFFKSFGFCSPRCTLGTSLT